MESVEILTDAPQGLGDDCDDARCVLCGTKGHVVVQDIDSAWVNWDSEQQQQEEVVVSTVAKTVMKAKRFMSTDSNVSKFVFDFGDAIAESVLYRYESYEKRTVICCSVQSGCPVGCTFCGTGKFFVRNLTTLEIVKQVEHVLKSIDCAPDKIQKFQIMFMSMGEPMLNYLAVKKAISVLNTMYPNAQLLVSTSAPEPMLEWQFNDFIQGSMWIKEIGLQFSVHESTDENRKKLIPTKTCSLKQIAEAGENWARNTGRKPFFNYCVHSGNDTQEDVDNLRKLFNPDVWETTLSVICESDENVKSSIQRQLEMIQDFSDKMTKAGFSIRVFNPAGQDDIGGGCGQLWYFQEWLKQKNIVAKP